MTPKTIDTHTGFFMYWGEEELPYVFGHNDMQKALEQCSSPHPVPIYCSHDPCPKPLGHVHSARLMNWNIGDDQTETLEIYFTVVQGVNPVRFRMGPVLEDNKLVSYRALSH